MTEPDYPLDLGLVIGTTNDDIWNAEMDRDPGLRALRKAFACQSPHTCNVPARGHFQRNIRKIETLGRLMPLMAPHEHESEDALYARLEKLIKEEPAAVFGGERAGGPMFSRVGMVRIGPDGIESDVPLPPGLREMFEQMFGGEPPKQ